MIIDLKLVGDIGFSVEASSEEEAIKTAMKKAADFLHNEKSRKYYLDFVKLEVASINNKRYEAPHTVSIKDIRHAKI